MSKLLNTLDGKDAAALVAENNRVSDDNERMYEVLKCLNLTPNQMFEQ